MTTRYFILRPYPDYWGKPRRFTEITEQEYTELVDNQNETVWITVEILEESTKAWSVTDSVEFAWIPKSLISDSSEDIKVGKKAVDIEVPLWWAEKEGLGVQ